MFSAGSVSATLSGNFSPAGFMAFDGAMKRAHASMDDAEKKMTSSGSKMNKAMVGVAKGGAVALGAGLLAVGAAAAKSVSLAADFEQQLSRLKATTGASASEMKRFKKDAMDAGAATKFSALDAAKAQVELAKGGLAVKDMSGGLKAAVGLAAAGEIDLALAGTTVVNAMKQFKIPGSEAIHVADALATAANTTTADVGHFAMALTQGGAAAKAAGMDLDSTVAILEAFADNSVKGSDAGTSMKAMLTQLAAPTNKQEKAAEALNLKLWDQQGRLKALPEMARELDGAFGGLTNKQRLAAASTIAGTDGMRGLLALYSSSPAKMQGYLDGLQRQGTAADVAEEKQDNLRGRIEALKGSLETAAISIGEGMLPALTDGAESLTGTINNLVKSGDLEAIGKGMGEGINWIVKAAPKAADAIQTIVAAAKTAGTPMAGMWKAAASGVDFFLGAVSTALDAMSMLGKAINATDVLGIVPDVDTKSLSKASDSIDKAREKLRNFGKGADTEVKIKIKGDVSQAEGALKRVQAMKIDKTRVISILASDTDAKSKIAYLRKLGIPAKTAKILADNADAISKIGSVRAALAAVQSKRITIETTRIERVRKTGTPSPGADTGRRAMGRPPGAYERALVGEGRGGELYGNPVDGWSWADQPTLVSLSPSDAVIPSDPAYSGRALGFMFAAMGVPGYAKGKKPKRGRKAAPGDLPIPAAVQFGAVPEDELNTSRDTARERYQKRKERVRDLTVDIREQKRKVAEAKGKPAKAKARQKLQDLERDQRRYRDGGDGLASLAQMRKQWQDLQKQATVLSSYNRDIERLNALQEADRARMATAAKIGDAAGWTSAKGRRGGILAQLREKYAKAVKLAKPGSLFAAELEGKLAGIEGEIADVSAEEMAAAESPFEGGLTKAEQAQLTSLEAAQAMAALTAGTEDDKAAAMATEGFLTAMLGQAVRDPSRGGAAAVRDLANQVASARSNVASFTGGAVNDNADVAAQLAQRDEQLRVARRESEINRLGLATFQGAGDIGQAPRIIINTLHPGDPDTLRAIGDAAVGGMSLQGSVSSPRTNLGL